MNQERYWRNGVRVRCANCDATLRPRRRRGMLFRHWGGRLICRRCWDEEYSAFDDIKHRMLMAREKAGSFITPWEKSKSLTQLEELRLWVMKERAAGRL